MFEKKVKINKIVRDSSWVGVVTQESIGVILICCQLAWKTLNWKVRTKPGGIRHPVGQKLISLQSRWEVYHILLYLITSVRLFCITDFIWSRTRQMREVDLILFLIYQWLFYVIMVIHVYSNVSNLKSSQLINWRHVKLQTWPPNIGNRNTETFSWKERCLNLHLVNLVYSGHFCDLYLCTVTLYPPSTTKKTVVVAYY